MNEVCGTPRIMHLSSGTTGVSAVHPMILRSHPQNFLHIISNVYVFKLLSAAQVPADEYLSVYGVLSHVEFHYVGDRFFVAESYTVESHVLAYESCEFIPGYLSETFESCYLNLGLEFLYGLFLFLLVVAVAYFIPVLDSEERGLQYIYMASSDKVRVVL